MFQSLEIQAYYLHHQKFQFIKTLLFVLLQLKLLKYKQFRPMILSPDVLTMFDRDFIY